VPPELEEIVLKAMAKDKAGRYASVMQLNEEVQRFLEGEKQREYNHQMAMAKVEGGRILVEKMGKLRLDLEAARKEAKEKGKDVRPHWPVEKKEEFWSVQEKVKAFKRQLVETFTEVGNTFQEALTFERRNPEARAALADLYWDQYLREEEAGDEAEMIRYEGLVRTYNDGQYDAKLKGDGTLTIATRHYPCSCLTEALEGAEIWLFRYEERRKILLPVFPTAVVATDGFVGAAPRGRPETGQPRGGRLTPGLPPDAVLDRLYDSDSPFRPGRGEPRVRPDDEGDHKDGPYRGLGLNLGRTPIPGFTIPMGSYILILYKEGFHPVRCPVFIGRVTDEEVNVTLYRDGEIPEGFVQVPAGRFIYQGDKENPYSGPKEIKEVEDAFISKFPVTCGEYLDFLNDTAAKDQEQAAKHVPRKTPTAGPCWPKDEEGVYHIPTEKWMFEAPEALKEQALKLEGSPIWWEEDWPVFSVSWEDLMAFGAWKTGREGQLFSLPQEIPWEKSARGTDGRFYPWGREMDATFCNMQQSHENGMRPTPVDSFPMDESLYWVRGLGGNSRDNVLNDPGEAYPSWRLCRGGDWTNSGINFRSTNRSGLAASGVYCFTGGRMSWLSGCKAP